MYYTCSRYVYIYIYVCTYTAFLGFAFLLALLLLLKQWYSFLFHKYRGGVDSVPFKATGGYLSLQIPMLSRRKPAKLREQGDVLSMLPLHLETPMQSCFWVCYAFRARDYNILPQMELHMSLQAATSSHKLKSSHGAWQNLGFDQPQVCPPWPLDGTPTYCGGLDNYQNYGPTFPNIGTASCT